MTRPGMTSAAGMWASVLSVYFLTSSAAPACTPGSASCPLDLDDDTSVAFVQRSFAALTHKPNLLAQTNTTKPAKDSPAPTSLSPETTASMGLLGIIVLLMASFIQQRRYINIEDELVVEATEKTKRQAKQFIGLALAMDRDNDLVLFQQQNIMLACRAGVATIGASLITFVPPLSDWFTQMAYEHKYAAVLVLWCMGKSIGATLSDLWDANVGTFLAFLFSFLIEGFYPGGFYEGDSPQKWMIGVGYTLFTSFVMMFGSWRNGVRVWCLSYHLGNMMTWLMPKEPGYVTTMSPFFHFTPRDSSFGYVVITLISSSICIMALSLPVPRMAHRLALRSMETSTGAIESLIWATLKIYTGEAQGSATCNLLRTKVFSERLTEELDQLSAHISASWWEHFDMGNFANVRRALGKHVIVSAGLQDCLKSMKTALNYEAANFKPEHYAIVKEISEPLSSMASSAMALFNACAGATKDGIIDDEEAQSMNKLIDVVEADIKEVTRSFKASAIKIGGESFKQQHETLECDWEFVFVMCSFARLIQDLGREHVSRKPRTSLSVVQAASSFNPFAGMSDPCHLEFAIRNSFSLLLCFIAGYCGVFGLIPAYSAGIATNAALLLSTSVGSALKKNMGRVQGLVVGTTVGTLLYGGVTAGGCASSSYFITGIITTFVFSSFSFFMFLSTKEYSFVFYLFAGFGVQKLLHVCEPFPGDPALASYFVNILIAIVCVTILAAVDLSMSNSACSDAAKTAMELMKSISHSITVSLVDGEPQSDHSKVKIQSRISVTAEKAFEGSLEPRLLSFPFQYEIYQALVAQGEQFLTNILTYRWAIRHSASSTLQDADPKLKHGDSTLFEILQKCPSYKPLHDSFLKLFDELVISVESQVVAANAVESVTSTMYETVDAQGVTPNLVKIADEIGPLLAEAKLEQVALDKDVEGCLHVILSVMDNWCRNTDTLQTTLQSSV